MEKFEIERIGQSVRKAVENSRQHYDYIESIQAKLEEALMGYLDIKNFDHLIKEVSKYDKSLAKQIKGLIQERNTIIEDLTLENMQAFEGKNLNRDFFTIMLFGRTMAGKSTTIQAFLGQNLKINGNGSPDWTKDISDYDWAGIRLVDTPGIEGFDETNSDIAASFIEQSDMVLLVISDDHIEPVIIEQMANLLKENKPFAVILNVKAGNPNVLNRPERIIRDDEVNGHILRIRNYLNHEFGSVQSSQSVFDIPIFPVYMQGAFIARLALSDDSLSDEKKQFNLKLYKYSRMDDVISYLTKTIIEDSSLLKSRSVYDSFICNLEKITEVLESKVYPLKKQTELLQQKRPTIKRDLYKLESQLRENFCVVQEIFDSRIANIDSFVDMYIYDEAKINLKEEYKKYLNWDEIKQTVIKYQNETVSHLNQYVKYYEEDLSFDLNLVSINATKEIDYQFNIDTKRIFDANVKRGVGKVLNTVGKAAANVGLPMLAAWGAANFWNPTGWAALALGAGALVVGGVVGHFGSKGIETIAASLDNQGKREIEQEKNNVIKNLKIELKNNFFSIENKTTLWLKTIITNVDNKIMEGLDISIKESEVYVRETFELLDKLSYLKSEVLKQEIDFVFSTILTPEERSVFNFHKIVRKIGYRLKIALIPTTIKKTNLIRHAMGYQNKNLYELRRNFGREIIDIVGLADNSGNWFEEQVIQAIGLRTIKSERVNIVESKNNRIVTILNCSKNELGFLYGKHKVNKKLAQELLGCKIYYEEKPVYGISEL